MSRVLGAILGTSLAVVLAPVILNDGKRSFYEDDRAQQVPGTAIAQEKPLDPRYGRQEFYDGVAVRLSEPVKSVFRSVREQLNKSIENGRDWLENGKSQYLEKERQVTSTLSSLHHRQEDLFPNSIYVLIGGLTGQIVARQRGILARFVTPLAFGVASFWWFLPETFKNTSRFVWKVEQRTLPEFSQHQVSAYEKAEKFVSDVEKKAAESQQSVSSSAESLKRKFANLTGLNLDEEVLKK